MLGAIAVIIAIVIVLPVGMLMTGGVASALFGLFLREDAEQRHAGSELIELNR